ncbi:uncharacterized protein BXZ73DRAFT_80194 [Epithele typhae]|uniref:uncharacterized protein n=1 Tax=Epithele typhae TaxID=378194 RepID=UPI0020076C0B|nr:uncharacterized protein BXZ73DRAFT_80194 [Epithele typhae]KAH9920253.1 hypothetical protein BXZ73DRAFT_80194 [Epithele typhae]
MRTPNDEAACRYASDEITATATIAEFRLGKSTDDRMDNERKLVQAATEILFNDPCRRCVSGITIEGSSLRFFKFLRSHVQCSTGFNFHKEPRQLAWFFLFAMYGSMEALGYDLSVERIPSEADDGTARARYDFRYSTEGRMFQTDGDPISEERAHKIVSRATRVWKVKEIRTNNGQIFEPLEFLPGEKVLKDVWSYRNALLEGEIQAKIFKELRDGAEEAQQYFLTILVDHVVLLSNGERDITPMCPGGKMVEWTRSDSPFLSRSRSSMQACSDTMSGQKPANPEGNALKSSLCRKHVRTVFEGCCKSVYELSDVSNFLRCVTGCAKALEFMQKAGFVHRDVSAGNCLYDPVKNVGRLADLEYAKPHNAMSASEPKTGTPDFMAVEYQLKDWLFYEWDVPSDPTLTGRTPHPPFIVHHLHDLESLCWVYVWFFHFRIPHQSIVKLQETGVDIVKDLHNNIDRSSREYFFCGVNGNGPRSALITRPWPGVKKLLGLLRPLYPSHPPLLAPIGFFMKLQEAYMTIQKADLVQAPDETWRLPVSTTVTGDLYTSFGQLMRDALDSLGEERLPVEKLSKMLDLCSPVVTADTAEVDNDEGAEPGQPPHKKLKMLNNGPAAGRKRGE